MTAAAAAAAAAGISNIRLASQFSHNFWELFEQNFTGQMPA